MLLLVDDNEEFRYLLKDLLEFQGYLVVEAENGEDALDIIQREGGAIDLVISDLEMPHLDGKGLLRWLQKHRPALRVVICTATLLGDEEFDELLKAGAYAVINKLAFHELVEIIKSMGFFPIH